MPDPDTPLTPTSNPSGKRDGEVLQVVLAGTAHGNPAHPVGFAALFGSRHGQSPAEVASGYALSTAPKPVGRPLVNQLTSGFTGLRPHIDDLITESDHFRIVFHHHHGIAQIHQAPELGHETLLITGMKPHAGFIEDVEDVDQGRTQGPGQVHPLHFAAGKGARLAIQGEVVEPHGAEKFQALTDFGSEQSGGRIAI